jgi:hypothetical protein
MSSVTVSDTSKDSRKTPSGVKPSHWVNNAGTSFRNPWESYREHTFMNLLSVSFGAKKRERWPRGTSLNA